MTTIITTSNPRLDYIFQVSSDTKVGSARGYITIYTAGGGNGGTVADLDVFVAIWCSLMNALSGMDIHTLKFKLPFNIEEAHNPNPDANLLEGAVLSFRIDDPSDSSRFVSFFIPAFDPSKYLADGVTVNTEDTDVAALTAYLSANMTDRDGLPLAEFVGGHRGFSRFETGI